MIGNTLTRHFSEDVKHKDDNDEPDGHQHDILRGQAHQLFVAGDVLRDGLRGALLLRPS